MFAVVDGLKKSKKLGFSARGCFMPDCTSLDSVATLPLPAIPSARDRRQFAVVSARICALRAF